jgi:carboxylesterase type B
VWLGTRFGWSLFALALAPCVCARVSLSAQVTAETNLLIELANFCSLFLPWTPTTGTEYLPLPPIDAFEQNQTWRVPLIIGVTHDEAWGYLFGAFHSNLTWEEYAVVSACPWRWSLDESVHRVGAVWP